MRAVKHETPLAINPTTTTTHVVALIPAHNEEESVAKTIQSLLTQTRVPDQIVVIPNGCSDNTVQIVRKFQITVLELPQLPHRKSEALNIAWDLYAREADVVVTMDADTVLPPNAVEDWVSEFTSIPNLGGSSSKFTMQAPDLLSRLQKAEFATWTDVSLRRGSTHVLAGTGCAIRGSVLRRVSEQTTRIGPWSYESATEDFELTYQIRKLGWFCHVSPTVRAYTDSMKTVRALWGQRMKWQVGTVEDLLRVGFNRLTARDWMQQALGLMNAGMKLLWLFVIFGSAFLNALSIYWIWWLLPPLFALVDVKRALRIPHRDRIDLVLAGSFIFYEWFSWLRSMWFVTSWFSVFKSRLTGRRIDRWQAQYASERG